MQRRRLLAELEHVAERRELAAGRAREQRERGAHRGRVGVVALVDQRDRRRRRGAARWRCAAALGRRGSRRAPAPPAAGSAPSAAAQAITPRLLLDPVAPGRADAVGDLGAVERHHDVAAGRVEPGVAQAGSGARAPRRSRSPGRSRPPRRARASRGGMRVVEVQMTAAPPGSRPPKISPLASAIAASRGEEAEMRGRDRRDHRDLRPHQAGERRDLAGRVHAELVDAVGRVARLARERERHAPVVVVAGGAGVGRRLGGERQAQRLLGAGLADAAGDRGDAGPGCARAPRGRARSAPHRVVDLDAAGRRRVDALPARGRPARPRPCRSASATKSWPSWCGPRSAMNSSPARDRARIDRDAARPTSRRARGRRSRPRARPRSRAARSCAALPAARRALRGPRAASSNGSTRSPTICPLSWPLPATTSTSPACSSLDRGADRGAPVADLDRRPGRPRGSRGGSPPGPRCAGCRR